MNRWVGALYIVVASAYGTDAYGECSYQTGCSADSASGSIGVPNTGFLMQVLDKPVVLVPTILIGALLIAVAILLAKKAFRKK